MVALDRELGVVQQHAGEEGLARHDDAAKVAHQPAVVAGGQHGGDGAAARASASRRRRGRASGGRAQAPRTPDQAGAGRARRRAGAGRAGGAAAGAGARSGGSGSAERTRRRPRAGRRSRPRARRRAGASAAAALEVGLDARRAPAAGSPGRRGPAPSRDRGARPPRAGTRRISSSVRPAAPLHSMPVLDRPRRRPPATSLGASVERARSWRTSTRARGPSAQSAHQPQHLLRVAVREHDVGDGHGAGDTARLT